MHSSKVGWLLKLVSLFGCSHYHAIMLYDKKLRMLYT